MYSKFVSHDPLYKVLYHIVINATNSVNVEDTDIFDIDIIRRISHIHIRARAHTHTHTHTHKDVCLGKLKNVPLGIFRQRWKDNIKTNLKEIG